MKLPFCLSVFLIVIGMSTQEYCKYDRYSFPSFQCIGLNSTSGLYVKNTLQNIFPHLKRFLQLTVGFAYSNISGLPSDLFKFSQRDYIVTYFRCEHCTVGEFPFPAALSFNKTLLEIDLFHSQITAINATNTKNLPFAKFMQRMIIAYGEIDVIQSYSFRPFTNLSGLYINDNTRIGTIQDYAFNYVSNLTFLTLERNQLDYIPGSAFSNLNSLANISLVGNNLETLQDGTFSTINQPKLKTLWLSDNPWNCICSLNWLKTYLNQPSIKVADGPLMCATPQVAAFNETDFCSPSASNRVANSDNLTFMLISSLSIYIYYIILSQ